MFDYIFKNMEHGRCTTSMLENYMVIKFYLEFVMKENHRIRGGVRMSILHRLNTEVI